MAAVYKTQGQNAQRLLAMNETLREREEMMRIETENLRKAREELAMLRRKVEQHDEIMLEKDRGIQVRFFFVLLIHRRSEKHHPYRRRKFLVLT
jgi:autophagy-related protein 16-1